ncbi:post-transcriptional regulator [Amphibacillus sediminis]|uniref:post-transcriptional regulator n=1 Tax=Amphibacillus sediminis TaxID=360185 RepID=UPI00083596AE|nr:post-transcriptional regulator [Amphibacillus sediminis]
MEEKHVEDWKPVIQKVIDSKARELQLFGYDEATPQSIWECLLNKVWRKNRQKMLHQIVEDILHLNGHTFMSYMTTQAHQTDDLMASIAAVMEDID